MAEEAEVKEGGEETQPPKKKSKKMLFIILGVGLALLGGGGFFAYTKFMAPKPAIEEEIKEESQVPEAVIGEIMELSPFVVNLSDPTGKRYLKMKISIEMETVEALDKAKKALPKLQDTVIMMLTSLTFDEVMTPEGKLQIRDELLERFNQLMRPDRVTNIYFTEFVIQ